MIRITTIIVLLGLLFGSSSAAVVFAQNSLPGEALYSIKSTSEDLQLALTFDQEERLAKALEFVNARYVEALIKESEGTEWTDRAVQALTERLDQNLADALSAIANMDEPGEGLVLLAETIEVLTYCPTEGILKRPRDRTNGPDDEDQEDCPMKYQLQANKLDGVSDETMDIAEVLITLYEKSLTQYPELLMTSEADLRLLEVPMDGQKPFEQSGNPDQGQSYGNQDPQAQYGDKYSPAYGEAPGETPRDPYAIKNNGTQNFGPGPGGSPSTGDPGQYEGDNGSGQKEQVGD